MSASPASLRELLDGPVPVTAPLVLNPLMALLAARAGFPALYLGGGAMGYAKACLEANLNLVEMAQAGLEISAATDLPLILDGACGWGDPMHVHRTIALAEAAGFAAIEIQDEVVPKRASHHVGGSHLIPTALMEAKVREAVAARRDRDFLVIARTDAPDLDEALRRAEAYRRAGADLLLVSLVSVDPTRIEAVAAALGGPLMYLTPYGALSTVGLSLAELGALGYRLVVDAGSLLFLMYERLQAGYAELASDGFAYRSRPAEDWARIQASVHETIGLDAMLAVEKASLDLD